jgi:undecaprenyl diphosphate synthase
MPRLPDTLPVNHSAELKIAEGAKSTSAVSLSKASGVPQHIAIIMDGNGRWARERGWPRLKGHEQGSQSVQRVADACIEAGVSYLTLYAFSTENWKRPAHEVAGLMLLLERFLSEKVSLMNKNGVRLATIGRTQDLPGPVRKRLERAIAETAHNSKLTLTLALNYGGRDEIVDAVKEIAASVRAGETDPAEITAELVSKHLYTRQMPDPDLLIRTSGEMRLSNFLLWQLSYTEIHVTQRLWPDFGPADLHAAIAEYQGRDRRYGGAKENPTAPALPS